MIARAGVVFVFALVVVACGASSSPSDGGSDAAVDAKIDVDCSSVGCGMNPGCGKVCTEVCGCCGCPYGATCGTCDASTE